MCTEYPCVPTVTTKIETPVPTSPSSLLIIFYTNNALLTVLASFFDDSLLRTGLLVSLWFVALIHSVGNPTNSQH
jgi:hypothetical protein